MRPIQVSQARSAALADRRFRVNCDALEDCAVSLRQEIQRLFDCLRQLELLISSMESDWNSDAAKAFTGKVRDSEQEYSQILESVMQFTMLMQDAAEMYANYDTRLADKIRRA